MQLAIPPFTNACLLRTRAYSEWKLVCHAHARGYQVADVGTKPLAGSRIQALLQLVGIVTYQRSSPQIPEETSAIGVIPVDSDPKLTSLSSTARPMQEPQALEKLANHSQSARWELATTLEPTASSTTVAARAAVVALLAATLVQPSEGGSDAQRYDATTGSGSQGPWWLVIFVLVVGILLWEGLRYAFIRLGRFYSGWLKSKSSLRPQLALERKKSSGPDLWEWNLEGRFLKIQRRATRYRLFSPYEAKLPVDAVKLSGIRITYAVYVDGGDSELFVGSLFDTARLRQALAKRWTGATSLILK